VRKFNEWLSHSSAAEASAINLSSLRHMINAAEPIDSAVLKNFIAFFTKYQLPSNVLKPTYGLAEHTVFVCSGGSQIVTVTREGIEHGQVEILKITNIENLLVNEVETTVDSSKTQTIVGCGYPFLGESVDLVIVDPDGCITVESGRVGEVWVRSPSKAQGYWGLPDLNKEDFHAQLAQTELVGDGYLRTGDLGFLYNDELFICGRRKDLIIVRGSNHYPQDIERTAEKTAAELRPGCTAAFAIKQDKDDTESIIFVAEVS